MAHIFFEKLENRRSTQSLLPPFSNANPYYPATYLPDGYNSLSYNPASALSTSPTSWLNLSSSSNQMWNQPYQWNQGWSPSLSSNQMWNQPYQWNQGWSPSLSSNQMSNLIQSWNLGLSWPFPSQPAQPRGLGLYSLGPYSPGPYGPYGPFYTYGVGFPIETSSSGILV